MAARCMLRVIAASAAITVAGLYCPEPLRGVIGISSVNAKEFYTRKRVKGRWITGHFAKKSFGKKLTVAKASRSEKRSAKASSSGVP